MAALRDSVGTLVIPGSKPIVWPYCTSCRVPVEKFTILPTSDHLRIRVFVECHGKTQHIEDDAHLAIKRGWIKATFNRKTFNRGNLHDPARL